MAIDVEEQLNAGYALRVGGCLREMRRQRRLSLQAVEAASGQEFKASVLGAYERGERAISVPRLQRLALLYGVPVYRLLPPDRSRDVGGSGLDPDRRIEEMAANDPAGVVIDLAALEAADAPEVEVLRRYLGMIRAQRQGSGEEQLAIRHEDVKVLALMFEATPASLRRRLGDLGLEGHLHHR